MSSIKAQRPKATDYVTLARCAASATGVSAGFAMWNGTWPEAYAAGGATMVIPFIVAIVVTLGLIIAWHILLGVAAHARKFHEYALDLGFGVALTVAGTAVTGWFLVGLIGGVAALESYQLDYVTRLKSVIEIVAANGSIDANVLAAITGAATNLDHTALAEEHGLVSGKIGRNSTFLSLTNAAAGLAATSADLGRTNQSRVELLRTADKDLARAMEDASRHEAGLFQDDIDRAANEVAAAAKIDIASNWGGISTGLAIDPLARHVIDQTATDITSLVNNARDKKRDVIVPEYRPIDAKWAVIADPQPLAWIAAVVIELIPLLFLGLLLTIWRDDEETRPDAGDGHGQHSADIEPLYPRPPRPTPVATPAE